jgi:hypothetical protein
MVNVAGVEVPFIDDLGISPTFIYLFVAVVVFIAVVIGVAIIFWYYSIYNRRVVLFENLAGQGYRVVLRDRARVVRVGSGGEELLYLMKKKKYISAYGRKMAKNTYWYAVGQDGYWYNFLLGDLDSKMAMLDIEPIDRDMRLESVAIRKNVEGRYKKDKWMDKYGIMLMNTIALIVFLVGLWYLTAKLGEVANTVNQGVEITREILVEQKQLISAMDNSFRGGSGITPA